MVGSTSGHSSTLGCIGQEIITCPASSAAAERVFSFVSTLSAQQEGALEDYIEASVMIRCNNNQRKLYICF